MTSQDIINASQVEITPQLLKAIDAMQRDTGAVIRYTNPISTPSLSSDSSPPPPYLGGFFSPRNNCDTM